MAKNKPMARDRLFILTQMGLLSAIIIVMTLVPYLGYISYGLIVITLIHIPVIIGGILLGPKNGAILGFIWGITCLLKAVFAPPSPIEGVIFVNPVVSVLPRILCGLVAGALFLAISKKDKKGYVSVAVSAIVASIVNTVLVLGTMYLWYGTSYGPELGISMVSFGGLFKYVFAAFTINAPIEIALVTILAIPIYGALKRSMKKSR